MEPAGFVTFVNKVTFSDAKLMKIDHEIKRLVADLESCKKLIIQNKRCREDLIERMSKLMRDRIEITTYYNIAAAARQRLDNMEDDRDEYLAELDDSDLEDEREQEINEALDSMRMIRQCLTYVDRAIAIVVERIRDTETRLKLHEMKHEAFDSRLYEKIAAIERSLKDASAKRAKLLSRNEDEESKLNDI